MPDSFNIHSAWRTHFKRALLRQAAGDEFIQVEHGLFWLWEWTVCRFGFSREGDGCLGGDARRIGNEAEWPMDPEIVGRYLGFLEEAELVSRREGFWFIHDLQDWQPHLVTALRRRDTARENGALGGRPRREPASTLKENPQKPRRTQPNPAEPELTLRTCQEQDQEQEHTKTPPPPPEAEQVAEAWNSFVAKHKSGQSVRLPLGKTVSRLIEKALKNPEFKQHWRPALRLLYQRPNDWVLEGGGQKLDWFCRVGREVNAAKIVELGYALGEAPKGSSGLPPEQQADLDEAHRVQKVHDQAEGDAECGRPWSRKRFDMAKVDPPTGYFERFPAGAA